MSMPLGVASVAKATAPRLVVEGINRTLQCLGAGSANQAVTEGNAASVAGAAGGVSVSHVAGADDHQGTVGGEGVVDWTLANLARAGANLTDGLFTLDAFMAECGAGAVSGVTVGTGGGAGDVGEATEGGVLPSRRRHSQPYFMTWWQQLAWTTVFALMLIVAIGGNAIVMWIVLAHRRMRTVTNYFLVNLSIADLMMAVFNCIFNFVYMLNSDWHFGNPYCTVNNFIANVTVAASVFTLTGISFDRYLAIVRPLQPRMSKFSARVTIVVIWVASMVLGFPCLLYSTTITYKSSGQVRTACILVWPDGPPMVSTMDYAYNIVLFVVTYVLPICAMAACYTSMGRELWGSRSIGEMTQRQIDSIRSKRKVVRMFIIIVAIFAVCWLPYHAYFIYTHHHRSVAYTKYVQHLYLAFYWLAMCNSMVNPLIYYWMNARFRQYFKNVVCEWHCHFRKPSRHEGVETPPMMRRYNNSQSYSRSKSGTADDCMRYGRGADRGNLINQGAAPLKILGAGVQVAQENNCDCCRDRQKTVKINTQGPLINAGRPILAIHQDSVTTPVDRNGADMSPFLRTSSKTSQTSVNSHNHSRATRDKHYHHHHHRHFLLSKSRKEQQSNSQQKRPNSQAELIGDKEHEGIPDQEIEWGSDNASCCGTDPKPAVPSNTAVAGNKAKKRNVFMFSMEEPIVNSANSENGNGDHCPLTGAIETTTSTKV